MARGPWLGLCLAGSTDLGVLIALAFGQDEAKDRPSSVRWLGGITKVLQVAGDGLLGLGQRVPHVFGPG